MTTPRRPTPAAGTATMRRTPCPVFLVGPPGSGKTTVGRRACGVLGLRFLDLIDGDRVIEALEEFARAPTADVVTLPWRPRGDSAWLEYCRRHGETVGLWAHPLEMQARSGHQDALFTPVPRLTTHGGFGRTGSGCREYRHISRSCEHVLDLGGLVENDAAQQLVALLEDLRGEQELSPAEREGMTSWVSNWKADFNADRNACEILVDAMARFTLHLKGIGTSPRALSHVRNDLNDAGFFIMWVDSPKGAAVLESFALDPSETAFRRKLTDSPRAFARFRSTWRKFAAFLREVSLIVDDGAQR